MIDLFCWDLMGTATGTRSAQDQGPSPARNVNIKLIHDKDHLGVGPCSPQVAKGESGGQRASISPGGRPVISAIATRANPFSLSFLAMVMALRCPPSSLSLFLIISITRMSIFLLDNCHTVSSNLRFNASLST